MPLLHGLIAEAARRWPTAVAVADGTNRLTFGEMEAAAAAVAAGLYARGVRRGDRVAVALRRSPDLIPVLLGVLKAGAGFVPCDVRTPAHRLRLVATDAGARVVITEPELVAHYAGAVDPDRITGARQLARTPAASVATGRARLTGADLAYVLYTSGSTGRPKGVAINHDGITNYLTWAVGSYDMAAGTGAPLFTSIGFDLTLTSLFGPLLAGRTVTVVPEREELSTLADLLRTRPDFSFIKLTPHHLDLLTELLDSGIEQAVRCVIVGGDALRASSVRSWRGRAPGSAVINEYGPTETVVGCVVHRVPPADPLAGHGQVPIGGPVPGASVYVLGPELHPVPAGMAGELYVGGRCASGWYLDRPALTAERFLPDPFGLPGGRMYRTGDRVRQNADGQLEYLGRTDQQVKVRGFRVEPAEVQAVLRSHPEVADAVVLARTGSGSEAGRGDGATDLVAAVVGDADPARLAQWLGAHLPEWMVPARIVTVEALPLTPNGKVDAAAVVDLVNRLPGEGGGAPRYPAESGAADAAQTSQRRPRSGEPRDTPEGVLAGLIAQVLGREHVGADENFFQLGGDSIRGIRLVARARKAGLRISTQDLVDHPTAAGLATVAVPVTAAGQGAPPAADTATGPVPLTAIQRWFFELDLPQPGYWNQAVLLDLPSGTDPAAMRRGVAHVTAVHDALRLRIERTADGWTQYPAPGPARVAVDVVDFADLALADRAAAVARTVAATHASLDLREGPLLRVVLIRAAAADVDRLLLVAHHLVVDTVSWQVLLDDLGPAYDQACRGETLTPLPPTGEFAAWARACADAATRPDVVAQAARWRQALPRTSAVVPRDDTRATNDLAGRAEFRLTLPSERVARLMAAVTDSGLRPHEVLLGLFVAAVCEELSCPPPMVHVEGHGREEIGLELDVSRTVGWFTSLYPVHLGGDRDPAALVWAAREAIRGAPLSGLGYGVARYLARAPELAHDPDPELLFNYLGRSAASVNPVLGWRLSDESAGTPTGTAGIRPYLLEYHPMIVSGELRSTIVYHSDCHRRSTIGSILTRIHDALDRPERFATQPAAVRYADAGLPADELERVLARYHRRSS